MCVQEVRAELAPWDKKIAEAESQVKLATTERDLVTQQQQEARQRLQVGQIFHMKRLYNHVTHFPCDLPSNRCLVLHVSRALSGNFE